MSSRVYPVFKAGSKQLRIFLPNFWMKLVKPTYKLLPNQVQFIVSPEMTTHDVKQYLEKIYKVPVVHVATFNKMGKTKMAPNRYVTKEADQKIAFVTLERDHKFEFPDLFATADKELNDYTKSLEEAKAVYAKKTEINIAKHGVPSWFSH